MIQREFWWPQMRTEVKRYVQGCDKCQRTKSLRTARQKALHPHDTPAGPWQVISVDLIGELPESKGYNAICVIVDRFSKQIHALPTTTKVIAEGMAALYRDQVFKLYRLLKKIIHDRGLQFNAKFMRELYKALYIEGNPSTAYHSQTNSQTECINQEIEQYLYLYVDYKQSD